MDRVPWMDLLRIWNRDCRNCARKLLLRWFTLAHHTGGRFMSSSWLRRPVSYGQAIDIPFTTTGSGSYRDVHAWDKSGIDPVALRGNRPGPTGKLRLACRRSDHDTSAYGSLTRYIGVKERTRIWFNDLRNLNPLDLHVFDSSAIVFRFPGFFYWEKALLHLLLTPWPWRVKTGSMSLMKQWPQLNWRTESTAGVRTSRLATP